MEIKYRHRKAARLIILGKTNKAIAKELGVQNHVVTLWKHDQDFKNELARAEDSLLTKLDYRIRNLKQVAVQRLKKMLIRGMNFQQVSYAIDKIIELNDAIDNRKRPISIPISHSGTIDVKHETKDLPKEARHGLFQYLKATKELVSEN